MASLARTLFPYLAAILAILCAWLAFAAMTRPVPSYQFLEAAVMLTAATLFGLASVSTWRDWRMRRAVSWITGGLLLLYAASVVTLGWHDMGGVRLALSVFLLTSVSGLTAIVAASQRSVAPPNTSLERTRER
jgi:hypothetical protein